MTTESSAPKAPNIRDVARVAGVSYQTVSRVLNDSPRLRPETRQRVLDVIENLTRLGDLPARGARFTAAPPAVEAFGTFPVRAFATI